MVNFTGCPPDTGGLVCPIVQNSAAVLSSVLLHHRITQHYSTLDLDLVTGAAGVDAAGVDAAGTLMTLRSLCQLLMCDSRYLR